jgi:hypothetical protein
MDGMAGAWNAGAMFCDSQDLQPFLLGGSDHFLQCAVGMPTRYRMRVYV